MSPDWQPTLTGETIELRPMREGDRDGLFAVASDKLLWAQHPDQTRWTREGFDRFFGAGLESKGALTIVERATGKLLGCSRYAPHPSAVEIGWTFVARERWGTGLNTELKRLMLAHAFRFVDAVVFAIGPDNMRSRKAVEKLGAALLPEAEALALVRDKRCSVVYRLLRKGTVP